MDIKARFTLISLTLIMGTTCLSHAKDSSTYEDTNRGPLGQDAQKEVLNLKNKYVRQKHNFRLPDKKYRPAWEKLRHHPVPEWLQDAKFGIYTHWGLYSIPANPDCNNTYVRYMYTPEPTGKTRKNYKSSVYESHKEKYGDPTEFGYTDFTKLFKCKEFDGEEYVRIMKDAGAKFGGLCIVHHDGFLMWESDVVPWNVGKMGPKRDIYGEFVKAARKADFKTLATLHHARSFRYATAWLSGNEFTEEQKKELDIFDPKYETWFFPQWGNAGTEVFNRLWLAKVREVIDKYHPDALWFDGLSPSDHCTEESHLEFIDYYYKQAAKRDREVAIFNKLPGSGMFNFPQGVGIKCYEGGRDMPLYAPGPGQTFQIDKAISYPWCYVEDKTYKFGPDYHIDGIIDVTARGGSYLMSLTPMASGEIPPREKEICAEIGDWLEMNGEAIYETRTWKIPSEGPMKTFKHKPDRGIIYWDYRNQSKQGEIRFTKKGDYMYTIFLDWPKDEFRIKSLGKKMIPKARIESIELLGHKGKLDYEQTEEALSIKPPTKRPCKYAYAFRIRLAGEVGDNMVANNPYTMEEESMSYDQIAEKHFSEGE